MIACFAAGMVAGFGIGVVVSVVVVGRIAKEAIAA